MVIGFKRLNDYLREGTPLSDFEQQQIVKEYLRLKGELIPSDDFVEQSRIFGGTLVQDIRMVAQEYGWSDVEDILFVSRATLKSRTFLVLESMGGVEVYVYDGQGGDWVLGVSVVSRG